MTRPQRFRQFWRLLAEVLGSLLLVLAAYGLFMGLLSILFPSGTQLKELIEIRSEQRRHQALKASSPSVEATLGQLVRDVRLRRGDSVVWGAAQEGMPLFDQDAVQTFDRSEARIAFSLKDHLLLGSNSLVLVRRLEQKPAGPRRYRVLLQGDLVGEVSAARKVQLEVDMAGHLARVGDASFRVRRLDSDAAALMVYAGSAELVEGDRRVRVPASWGATLKRGVPVTRAYPLPPPPRPAEAHLLYRYRHLPPLLRLAWSGAEGEYHFQLFREGGAQEPLLDRRVKRPELSAELERGEYWWQVSRVEEGREGPFSSRARLELRQLLAPPKLTVSFPPRHAVAGPFLVSGHTDPEAKLLFDGAEVPIDGAGRFEREVTLQPGVNLIRVEALDGAGNASYASAIVYGSLRGEPAP